MPLERILEPEVMSGEDEAEGYGEMDFSATDLLFAERAAEFARGRGGAGPARIVDLGCGDARIPLATAAILSKSEHANVSICAVEMSHAMLQIAARNLERAGADRFHFVCGDVKSLPFAGSSADVVVSNSLVHHIPDPREVFREVARVAGRDGAVLIRDLVRPESEEQLDSLVAQHSAGWGPLQKKLFADSLHAALTVEEVRAMLDECGLEDLSVSQITDRHWSAERPPRERDSHG